MHLVGFIKRTYHDARSPERYIAVVLFVSFGVLLALANKKIKVSPYVTPCSLVEMY